MAHYQASLRIIEAAGPSFGRHKIGKVGQDLPTLDTAAKLFLYRDPIPLDGHARYTELGRECPSASLFELAGSNELYQTKTPGFLLSKLPPIVAASAVRKCLIMADIDKLRHLHPLNVSF